MRVDLVGQNWLDLIWPHVAGRLEELCGQFMEGKFRAEDIKAECEAGRMQMWVAGDETERAICGVCITEVVNYPQGRWGRILHLAGDRMPEWLQYLSKIEEWFQAQGCCGVEATGRREWVRVLKPFGYRGSVAMIERRLA